VINRPPELRIFGENDMIVDLFAGGGGASVGIEWALGRSPDIAINHDSEAISIHRVNHPDTKHYIEDVWKANPRKLCRGKRVRLMWLSPDCKHFSKAKGGKPREKKIRSLAWVAVYWAKQVKPDVICLENVEEFQKWGPLLPDGTPCPARMGITFQRFKKQLQNLGYQVEHRELVCADYGAPTTRKRLFLIARCDGNPIVWPQQTHDKDGKVTGRKWLPASDCIDWTLPCPSIFSRKKALAENTQRRIARGIERFVKKDPFIVPVTHTGDARVHGINEPLRTITGAQRGEFALVAPHITKFRRGSVGQQLDLPMPTVTAGSYVVRPAGAGHALGLVSAFLKPRYGEREGQDPRARDIKAPMPTVVPTGNGGDLVTAFLAKHNAGHEATGQRLTKPVDAITGRDSKAVVATSIVKLRGTCADGQPVTEPLATVSAQGNHFAEVRAFLMKYHRDGGQLAGLKEPMPTVVANDSLALVTVGGEPHVIVDIGMRMLQPRELFRAHAFPENYVIERGADGEPMTKEAQVRMVGNSVPPVMAMAIVRAQFAVVERAEAVA
jgi:DNA (cytosine-5)-methyltransferase 1